MHIYCQYLTHISYIILILFQLFEFEETLNILTISLFFRCFQQSHVFLYLEGSPQLIVRSMLVGFQIFKIGNTKQDIPIDAAFGVVYDLVCFHGFVWFLLNNKQ